jgi:ATP-dependent Zn protease
MAADSPGLSNADIAAVCNEAGILHTVARIAEAPGRPAPPPAAVMTAFEAALHEAFDNVILGRPRATLALDVEEKRRVAFHEAGHAVTAWALPGATAPVAVSVAPRGRSALGYTRRQPRERHLCSKEEWFADLCVLLGGRVAEELFCGGASTGAADDFRKATEAAEAFVVTFAFDRDPLLGYGRANLGADARERADSNVSAVLRRAKETAAATLTGHETTVRALVAALLTSDTVQDAALSHVLGAGAGPQTGAPAIIAAAEPKTSPVLAVAVEGAGAGGLCSA